jgi:hypothetical protein
MATPTANLGTDVLTNPTVVQLKCMDSITTPMANLGTDMLTNPTVVRLHVKMHGFYNNHCKPWHTHAYKPYQLFNCT